MTERHHCGPCNLLHDGPECPRCSPPRRPVLARRRLPVVMIPQYPTERLRSGEVVRRHLDLTDAQRYGEIVELLDTQAKPWDHTAVEQMDQMLADSSADDWLLAVGNPTMIAMAAAAFGSIHGSINVLQWQSRARRYEAVRVAFTEDGTEVTQAPGL